MADDASLAQEEIDRLLQQAAQAEGAVAGGSPAPKMVSPARSSARHAAGAVGDDIQYLLEQAEQAIASVDHPVDPVDGLSQFTFRDFAGSPPSEDKATLDLLRDVELDVKIELGRAHMLLEDVLKLRRGSVVALDKLAGDPVDIYVNGRMVARGEVLVLNDNFCVRVAELITGDEMD